MDGAEIEGRNLKGTDSVGDHPAAGGSIARRVEDAVLWDHLDGQTALGDYLELSGARVHVWGVEAARAKETDCHS